jgi:hypothetical protein
MVSKNRLLVDPSKNDGSTPEPEVSFAPIEAGQSSAIIGRLEPVRVEKLAGALARFAVDLSKP